MGSNSFVAKLDWNTLQVLWRKEIVGAKSYAVAVDGYGNVWTTGEFSGSVDFNPGSGKFLLTSTRGYPDMFVCKLDAAGSFAWAGRAGGDNIFTVGNDLAVDGQGNVYVAGTFFLNFSSRQSKVDFDPGAGKYTLSTTKTSAYVLKLNNQGGFVWADGLNGAGATGLAIDADSNLYAAGSMSGTVDFDPGAGQYNMVGYKDAYIWKLDNAGKLVWAAVMGGSDPPQGSDYPNAVSVDALGNVFATGSFATRRDAYEDFDPTSGVAPLQSAGGYGSGPDPAAEGSTDLFVVKLTQPSSLSGSLAVSASERLKRTALLAAASSGIGPAQRIGGPVLLDVWPRSSPQRSRCVSMVLGIAVAGAWQSAHATILRRHDTSPLQRRTQKDKESHGEASDDQHGNSSRSCLPRPRRQLTPCGALFGQTARSVRTGKTAGFGVPRIAFCELCSHFDESAWVGK